MSHGSAELLGGRGWSVFETEQPDLRGEAPSHFEAIAGDNTMTSISLNDEPNPNPPHQGLPSSVLMLVTVSSVADLSDSSSGEQGGGRTDRCSRFSFLLGPFSSSGSSSSSHTPHTPPSIATHAISPSLQIRSFDGLVHRITQSQHEHSMKHPPHTPHSLPLQPLPQPLLSHSLPANRHCHTLLLTKLTCDFEKLIDLYRSFDLSSAFVATLEKLGQDPSEEYAIFNANLKGRGLLTSLS
ncbi:hypothetical protein HYDPIDRAFT_32843 [Hydnomerulius pinastri MD-312]|uniref:Uncharacterized protein n=1 Tax=Hydnomerulius pinastri MD-312 TaxID=994086 RepID=A0A0C9W974_9AGAM|nr:hypothetical protein HYDPIDRAFT_32843 [Hydnomerulius pinastri MD-312]